MMKKRCPWCGEIVPEKFFPFAGYVCPSCGNRSKLHLFGGVYLFLFSIGILLLIALDHFFSIKSVWLIVILFAFTALTLPLETDSRHFVPQKKSKAEFTLLHDMFVLKKKIVFSEKRIFPICFVDDNDVPISHMICCSFEDTKFSEKNRATASVKFVPLSDHKVDFPSGTKFFLFIEETRAAEGRLTDDVK